VAKYNRARVRAALASEIRTEAAPSGRTYEGAPAFARDAKSELFLLAVANMVGEQTFYETAADRDSRYQQLARRVAVEDAGWTCDFLGWLRGDGSMRSAALVGAVEAVKARLGRKFDGTTTNRSLVSAVLQRADEPGELLAYWMSRYGRAIPKPVKRGVADAVRRLYTQRALLKYDTASHGFRFGDVVDLVHPAPAADKPWQGDLFQHALDRRHHRDKVIPEGLSTLRASAGLRRAAADDPTVLLDPVRLPEAGWTWEDALSLAGSTMDKSKLWIALIPSMGYMALLRNLRNFDEAGVPDDIAALVAARLADPAQVARSRQFPMRFLSAYRAAASLRWAHALGRALTASLSNVPVLAGRTLILVDVSGSMQGCMSARSELTYADAAGVFGAALAMRTDPTLVWFNERSGRVNVPVGGSLLRLVEAIPPPDGGTFTAAAVERWYARHDRVVIVTDEQAHYGGQKSVDAAVPPHVPVYTWNIAGYRRGHAPSGSGTRHTFGGLTDAAFRMIQLLEGGRAAVWPWQIRES
jgi:hypothetical protein